ncbi:low molecular weight protein-tyrosine-phosphatase [soil metagenome]
MNDSPAKTRLLFVCLGNICRSPAADGVMQHFLKKEGLEKLVVVDSAGTANYHVGSLPDDRMRRAAAKRGIALDHRGKHFRKELFDQFDLILVMDDANLRDVRSLDPQGKHHGKIKLFAEYCTRHKLREVPDPYTGDASDFEFVLDLMEDGCTELVRQFKDNSLLKPL